jgi:hypothetical protein
MVVSGIMVYLAFRFEEAALSPPSSPICMT